MAYGEYADSGRSFGKCLYQLSKIGVPLRIVESVIFSGDGTISYCNRHFATINWSDDTPIFLFSSDFSDYQALQQRYNEIQENVMAITAKQARKITEENLATKVIEPYIEILDKAITVAAESGMRCIDVFKTLNAGNIDYPRTEVQQELRSHYQRQGFSWVEYADPDPGHPASGPYTKIEW